MAMNVTKKEEGYYSLDVTGYVCPHPQLYTKKVMQKLGSGDRLELVFDNPSSAESISAMCASEGNPILEKKRDGAIFIFEIQKG
ncbi:MAG: sulfurtransferase TusA family protein [Deltaproteobacteria bacterium]|jgi:tRNA 2-thiouridine synthesizing protein A|nr:MAG: sulfurtransferase TusA family protein [Deltaproteobacteria bacterium]